MHLRRQLPHHRAALSRAQDRIGRLTDQLEAEQGDLVGPLGPPAFFLIDQSHAG
ncbi:hypothetical protein ACFVFJ_46935 [Streptomyces sp. NPDC057717]|uniref:hypothetical protein n=1 Tax=Streptomyces sp. NPDC057717 TaxID=3346224 RepID=UPI0036C630BF